MPNTYSSEWKLPSYIPLSLTMFAWHFVVVEESFLYIFYLYIHSSVLCVIILSHGKFSHILNSLFVFISNYSFFCNLSLKQLACFSQASSLQLLVRSLDGVNDYCVHYTTLRVSFMLSHSRYYFRCYLGCSKATNQHTQKTHTP